MTTNDKKTDAKVSYTLRIKNELNEKVAREADKLGLSKQAYITMILHKAIQEA